ncbi:MAG: dTDP-glucose 4,6-dehydratase [Pirellulales bacterium]
MNAVLVTGGAGFIGSAFVRMLLRDTEWVVVNLDKLTYAGNLDSLEEVQDHPRHVFVQGDVADRSLLTELLHMHQVRGVLHFAAESHVDRSIDGPLTFVKENVLGTCQLLEAVRLYWQGLPGEYREQFRFLHVSTDEVFGNLDEVQGAIGPDGLFRETTPYAPNSPYAASKAAADHFVRAYQRTFGLPTLITHASNNYGPFQFPEKLVPLMILHAIQGKRLPLYGDGLQVRDWLHVEDHCAALKTVWEFAKPGSVYNIGGNSPQTNLSVVQAICELVDSLLPDLPHAPCRGLIQFVADRPGHDRRYAVDIGRIGEDLGWSPRKSFMIGLQETVIWYLSHEHWLERVTSGKYQGERLGLAVAAR